MIERPGTPEGSPFPTSVDAPSWRWGGSRWVLAGVAALLIGQLAVRAWIVSRRGLFTDDVLYGTQAVVKPLFSAQYLVEDRGGHFMPAAMLLHGVLYRLFPLQWTPFAVTLMVLQVAASLAVLRLLRVLMGDRPALMVPLAVYLFCPLSLGPFTWWAAGMNSLPLQIGLAWVVADAVLLLRTGRRRYAVTGTAALLITLLFYERAVLVPLLAFGLVAVLLHVEGVITPLRVAWHRGRALWIGTLLVLGAWAAAFVVFVPSESVGSSTLAQVGNLTRVSATSIVPALVGGPWTWFDGAGTPLASPPSWASALSAIALAVLVGWSVLRRRGAGALWGLAAGYFLIGALLVGAGRGTFLVAGILPLAYRYFAAEAVVAAIVIALLFAFPPRTPASDAGQLRMLLRAVTTHVGSRPPVERARRIAVPVLTVCFLASSLYSTVTYMRVWSTDPTRNYLAAATTSLAAAGTEPMLDWNVPDTLIWGLSAPWNRASMVFGPVHDRPGFGDYTYALRQLDDTGHLRQGRVAPGVLVNAGPEAGCGWTVAAGRSTDVRLGAPLFNWAWTAELHYVADREGVISVTMGVGKPLTVPIRQGSHTVYLRIVGDGAALRVDTETPGLGLCIDAGAVGNLVLS